MQRALLLAPLTMLSLMSAGCECGSGAPSSGEGRPPEAAPPRVALDPEQVALPEGAVDYGRANRMRLGREAPLLVAIAIEGGTSFAVDAETSGRRWEQQLDGVYPGVGISGELLVLRARSRGVASLVGFDPVSSAGRWRHAHAARATLLGVPVAVGDRAYAMAVGAEACTGIVSVHAAHGGEPRELATDCLRIVRTRAQELTSSTVTPDGAGTVFVTRSTGAGYELVALSEPGGEARWSADVEASANAPHPPIVLSGVVAILDRGPHLFDRATGRSLWHEASAAQDLVFGAGLLIATTAQGVVAYHPRTGERAYEIAIGGPLSPQVEGDLLLVRSGDTLRALDAATGAARWTSEPILAGENTSVAMGSDAVYVSTLGEVHRLERSTGRGRVLAEHEGRHELVVVE